MSSARADLPTLRADLLLLHAPAVFEFRGRRDIHFPFLGTSGDVPITPLYEYFPIGFKTLQQHLTAHGHRVALLNLASLLLRFPGLELDRVLGALEVSLVGIDLHWMVHVQGVLAIAERLKKLRPELPIVLGGLSASYFADELIAYRCVDMVLRGYDTHQPLVALLAAVQRGGGLAGVPNLLFKDADGRVQANPVTHLPRKLDGRVDWSTHPPPAEGARGMPIRELVSAHTAGCAHDCPWCGGSASAFRRIFGPAQGLARRPLELVRDELASIAGAAGPGRFHMYAAGSYNEPPERLSPLLEMLADTDLRSLSIEQFRLPTDALLERLARASPRTTITLSPQSHHPKVARLAGRGVFTHEQMEAWIGRALERGIAQIDLWYFVGMPEQDEQSVATTVERCAGLLERFPVGSVNPMICPMVPWLDPASTFFVEPERHGYQLYCRTVEEHRRAMRAASLPRRMNYRTRWLSRADIVRVGFRAVRALTQARAAAGLVPRSAAARYCAAIDEALALGEQVMAAERFADEADRSRALAALGDELERHNQMVLFGGVSNQAFPLRRRPAGRWFDELGWSEAQLRATTATTAEQSAGAP